MMREISWTTLTGISGDGPVPHHFHRGHPTPWSEGRVIEVLVGGLKWVGNFQTGDEPFSEVIIWEKTETLVVLAQGGLYLVPVDAPERFVAHESASVCGIALSAEHSRLFVADHDCVLAYDDNLEIEWRVSGLGQTSIMIESCEGSVLQLSISDDPDLPVRRAKLGIDGRGFEWI